MKLGSKIFIIQNNMFLMLSLCVVIFSITCSPGFYLKGQYFPELENVSSDGTILFFYLENTEYLQSEDDLFGETQNIEFLISQIKVDLNMLKEKYPDLRIFLVDVHKKRELAMQHQVSDIPTLLLYDRMGYEVGRWLPGDFKRGGGIFREVGNMIEKIKISGSNQNKD
ncbi:MAG TPA: thioredoxin family protein [bacterium]